MPLSAIERRLEKLVEGVFGATLKSGLQPVELGRRLTRAMDAERSVGVRGLIAPNLFAYWLSESDAARLEPIQTALMRDLTLTARDHATAEGYSFVGPVVIEFNVDPKRKVGQFELEASADASAQPVGPPATLTLADGSVLSLDVANTFTIGRMPESSLTLADGNASRHHAQITHTGEGFLLADLGSTNGTYVNGVAIKEQLLASGDTIGIGAVTLRFEQA